MDVLDNVWILICYFVEFLEKEGSEWTWRHIGNDRANVTPVLVSKTITYAELCDKVRELLEVDTRLNDIEMATIVPGMTNVPIPPMKIDCDNNVKWYLSVCREVPLCVTLLKKDVEEYEENDGLGENKEHATIVVHDNSLNELQTKCRIETRGVNRGLNFVQGLGNMAYEIADGNIPDSDGLNVVPFSPQREDLHKESHVAGGNGDDVYTHEVTIYNNIENLTAGLSSISCRLSFRTPKFEDLKKKQLVSTKNTDSHDFTSQTKGILDSTGLKGFAIPHDMSTPAMNKDTTGSSKTSGPIVEAIDSVVKKIAAQLLQRMSAQEDSFELDDDILCNGVEPRPFAEGRVTTETSPSKPSPTEEPKLDQTTPLSEEKSVPDPISSKISDVGNDGISKREPSTGSALSVSQATNSVSESVVLPQLVSAADKPKEASDSHPFFSFSSKTLNEVPSSAFSCLSSEPFTCSESKQENSSSLVNVASAATGAQLVTFGSDKGGHLNSLISGDTNGKSGTALSVTSNGPRFSSSPAFSSAAASSSDTNQISTESSSLFTSSTSISTTSTSGASTSSVFGSTVKPSFSALPAFKFGSFVDPSSTVVSLASATTISESRDLKTKLEKASGFMFGPTVPSLPNPEDSVVEDTIQSSAPSVPVFGQPTVSPFSSGFMFGPTVPSLPNPKDSMVEDTIQSSAPSVPVFGQPTVSPSSPGFMFG